MLKIKSKDVDEKLLKYLVENKIDFQKGKRKKVSTSLEVPREVIKEEVIEDNNFSVREPDTHGVGGADIGSAKEFDLREPKLGSKSKKKAPVNNENKKKELTDEEKKALSERMAKIRSAKKK